MIIQGNFVSQNFWTLRAAVTSGHKVLGVNVALDIVWNFGLISTLKALIPSTATKRCHHSLNLSCKKQCNVRDRYVIILYSNSKLIFISLKRLVNSCQMIVQGMFVLEKLWAVWAIITSWHNVFRIDMTFDIGWDLGMISTLQALIPGATSKISYHTFNLS